MNIYREGIDFEAELAKEYALRMALQERLLVERMQHKELHEKVRWLELENERLKKLSDTSKEPLK